MLVDQPLKKGDTVSLKLTSGEEVLARFEEEAVGYIKVSKPMTLTMNQQGMGLMPFMFTIADGSSLKIHMNSIVTYTSAEKETAKQYIQSTTGLAT